MKTFRITVRSAAGVHQFIAVARDGAEAAMLAWDRFPGEPLQITIRGGRA